MYAVESEWRKLPPWDRYLARVHAVALTRPQTVFCLESAAVLLGLPIFGEPRDIHVLNTHRRTSNRNGEVFVHVSHDEREVSSWAWMSATSVAHTVADLVRVLPPAFGLAVADASISPAQSGACTIEQIGALARDQVNRRGRRVLHWVLERANPRAESSGESVSRAVIEWLGYPSPELQATFRFEGAVDRTDFRWEEHDMVGESDGYGKYDASDPIAMKAHFIAEKLREDRLRRHIGRFARWDWRDTMRVTPLDRALGSAGLPRTGPAQHAMLATLRQHPRSFSGTDGRPR